jgi:hypothetical protein
MLVTSRLLWSFGVGALVVAPLALTAGSIGVLVSAGLGSAMFLRGADQVLRFSIDRTAYELVYMPLPQADVVRGKSFIDGVVSRVGEAVGSLVVIVGLRVAHVSLPSLSALSLCLLACWICAARLARSEYAAQLLRQVKGSDSTTDLRAIRDVDSARGDLRGVSLEETDDDLVDGVLQTDPELRLTTLKALDDCRAHRRLTAGETEAMATALAAEVVGLYWLVEHSRNSVCWETEYRRSVERVCHLLTLLSPDHDLHATFAAVGALDSRTRANALEHLEHILAPGYRRLLIPLLEIRH